MLPRIFTSRSLSAGAGAAALAAAVLLPGAGAATAAPASVAHAKPTAAETKAVVALTSQLSDRAAGSYFDTSSRRLVVNITDPSVADQVRATGAVARVVRYSTAQLHAAAGLLARQARIPGTAWGVDPRKDQVVVTADPTVTGAKLIRLDAAVHALGNKAVLRHRTSPFKPLIAGGDAIWGSGVRCSLGFNVSVGGAPYFLTAGHCGNASASWSDSQGGGEIGQTVDSHFPGTDYALVQYDDPGTDHPSTVDLYDGSIQQITRAADAYVGEQVQRSGSTTGVYGGQVTALDATVNYQEGSVFGLIDTTVCAEPGDSGGALFDGDAAIGLTSGGSGDCTSGGETFFQPVTAALSAEGATIP
ncbi:S1 family peptidase [Streptomyces sp. NPDC007856]|uniref:S1 family peptidase n=1 Tax=Streptomyces sp. NPDC007856 TaxID=3364781 RepID=UPI003691C8A8